MNERLLIAAEEAEASAEEVETLNEEMQATSEELETLNEELQATVEELNTTNEELGARGSELERLISEARGRVTIVEDENALLARAFLNTPIAFALLDEKGSVVQTSALYDDLATLDDLPRRGQAWNGSKSAGHNLSEIRLHAGKLLILTQD